MKKDGLENLARASKTEEGLSKIKRIDILKSEGFNVPRIYMIPEYSIPEKLEKAILWAKEINSEIYNIRTYGYNKENKRESLSTVHMTDISLDELETFLRKEYTKYMSMNLMIDCEIPDNGRISGRSVLIKDNPKLATFFKDSIILEFVIKEKRAMVRDADKNCFSYTGSIKTDLLKDIDIFSKTLPTDLNLNLPDEIIRSNEGEKKEKEIVFRDILYHIIIKTMNFYKSDVILEWTMFNSPSGINWDKGNSFILSKFSFLPELERYIVWWEYRKA